MRDDLLQRLRELGVVKGARELATPRRPVAIQDLVRGHFYTTSRGRCFIAEETYPLDHLHGDLPLSSFLELAPQVIAQIARDDALASLNLRRACFLDTETTGLSGGAGTMPFMVGLGYFSEDGFRLHQYFLRDPGDEPAMIESLAELLPKFEALISFNGRGFDVPIIENRFILAHVPTPTAGMPHLDLLLPARRLWRYHLPSRALGAIERKILGLLREQDDVPGSVIPWLYRDYLRTGDAREMQRVFYHNAVDILSLVTLAARLCRVYADPWNEPSLNGAEFYGLARWYEAEDRLAEAKRAYRTAIAAPLAPELRPKALRDLAYFLKRAGRRAEAFAYWQQLALETTGDVLAYVELAKYFEWRVENLSLAAGWTRAALAQVKRWPQGERRAVALAELRHRLARLEKKTGNARTP